MSAPRRLYRDTADRKIAGVCSGLARHIRVDPLLVRIGFVVALLLGGASIIAYLLMWWLVDPAPAGAYDDTDPAAPANASASPGASDGSWSPPSSGDDPGHA